MGQLVTIPGPNGQNFTVDSDYAANFQGLMDALVGSGVNIDPNQSGGYANRTIRGGNSPSSHASGQAVDLNWEANPVTTKKPKPTTGGAPFDPNNLVDNAGDRYQQNEIPPELARTFAQRFGLEWGGDWRGMPMLPGGNDPMHFQVPRDPSQRMAMGMRMQPQNDPTRVLATLMPPAGPVGPAAGPASVQGPTAATPAPAGPQFPQPAGYGPPQVAPTNPEAQQRGWSGWLDNPVNRAFLLQFGIQAMQPAWGGLAASFGQALGAGAEAASGTAKLIRDEEVLAEKINSDESKADLERKNRLQVAQIGADSRVEVANVRGQYSLQRAAAVGAKTPNELAAYNSVFNRVYQQLSQNNILLPPDQQLTPEMIMEQAGRAADEQYVRFRGRPGQNATGGQNPSVVSPPPVPPPSGSLAAPASPAAQNEPAISPPRASQVTPPPFMPGDQRETYNLGGKGTVQGTPPVAPAAPARPPAAAPTGGMPSRDSSGKEYPEGSVVPGPGGVNYVAKGGRWVRSQ